jgi:hypothetical protein
MRPKLVVIRRKLSAAPLDRRSAVVTGRRRHGWGRCRPQFRYRLGHTVAVLGDQRDSLSIVVNALLADRGAIARYCSGVVRVSCATSM